MPKRPDTKSQDNEWEELPPHFGEFLCVADYYTVSDWQRLVAVLTERDDVTGNLEEGWVWHGLSPDGRREVAELEKEDDTLVAETLSEADAERTRKWLESLDGSPVEFMIGSFCYGPAKS